MARSRVDPVLDFAKHMIAKLEANRAKGSWEQCSVEYLLDRIGDEIKELREAIYGVSAWGWDGEDPIDETSAKRIISEAADVANFAMMIADKAARASARHKAEKDRHPNA